MKKKLTLLTVLLVLCTIFLQGCSAEGETSIKVVTNDKGTRIEATLKADESKNYEWKYFTKNGNVTESATEFSNDLFSDTYTQKYGFVIDERASDVIYFVLYKTDDVEGGKVYEYEVSYNDDGEIELGKQVETWLKSNPELLKRVEQDL